MSLAEMKGFARDALLAIAIAFIAWFLWMQLVAPRPLRTGPAPAFTLNDLTGRPVALADHEGLVVLNFWFTSCPPCRHEIPELAAFHTAHPDVPLYGVSVDDMEPAKLERLARKLGINYPVLHDTRDEVAGKYEVSLFPTTVVVDHGQIRNVWMGEVTRQSLESMVGL
ncbi:MAG: TlpA family protein disulfide reductase [Alphaproteobacteria bacterium]|nr:TlpA family protein disulfide reductase [Alphaproteobacteria bacterium]